MPKNKTSGGMNREARGMRTRQIIFVVICVILILSWILSLIVKI